MAGLRVSGANFRVAPEMSLREAFAEAIDQRLRESEGSRITFMEWALRCPEPKSGTLDFDVFPMQRELYEEAYDDRELCVCKGTQVGVSAWAIRWAMYQTDVRGLTGLYIFPTLSDVYDFCLHEDEQVLMADGTLRRIADVRVGDVVLSSDGRRTLPDVVAQTWNRGRQPVVRVELAGGRQFRATVNHRVYTQRGWVPIGELRLEDLVAVPAALPGADAPVDVPDGDAFLLAMWLAEGNKTGRGFGITVTNDSLRLRLEQLAVDRGWRYREDERWHIGLSKDYQRAGSPMSLLRFYGVWGMQTDTIRVPTAIMRAPNATVREFVRTYIACDGCVRSREVTITTISERMARDLQVLVARLGIAATQRHGIPSLANGRPYWTLAMAGKAARDLWTDIPGKPMPTPGLQAMPQVAACRGNSVAVAVTELRAAGMTQQAVATRLGISQAAVGRARRDWCVPAGDLLWSKVREIVPEGVAATYDLTTSVHHCFFVEGALTHNSDARIKPVIDSSAYLRSRVLPDDPQNKGLKKIGLGYLYLRGSESKRKLDSVDADTLVCDEFDTLNSSNLPDAERRLSGPMSKGLIRRVGVPSVPGFGIAKCYEESDQRKWHVKCEACNEWQPISFDENVDKLRELVVCRKCLKPLRVGKGEWVAAFPDRAIRGYHVTRLIAPTANIHNIVIASTKRSPIDRQVFFNKDLGEPYAPAEGRLSREAIAAAQSAGGGYVQVPGYIGPNIVTMGVDVASTRALNVRISEHISETHKRALFIGEVDNFDTLSLLMGRYQVNMCAIDHLPEGRLSRAFAERFPGRVFVVAYNSTPTPKDAQVVKIDEAQRFASVRRVEAMDAAAEMIRAQRNLLPMDLPEGYVDAMGAPVRLAVKDELGRVTVVYRSTGQDDWFHAETYDVLASELHWYRMARDEQDRDVFRPLDEMLEFERSGLAEVEADHGDYQPGGREDGDPEPPW